MKNSTIAKITVSLIIALGVIAWVLRHQPKDVVRLPSGHIIRFLAAVPAGQNFTTERLWHKLARKVLPARLRTWIPQTVSGRCGGGTNSITVYFEVIDPTGAMVNDAPWVGYLAEDETGFRYARDGGSCSFGMAANRIYGLTIEAFPRRQKRFTFHLLDRNNESMAVFAIDNPWRGPFPEWQPEALPILRTNGPVALTLAGLNRAGTRAYPSVRPDWIVAAMDPGWADAKAVNVRYTDATGNSGPFLSPRESAWKLHATVHRQRAEFFSAEERLLLTNLALPKAGEFTPLEVQATRAGVQLVVHWLAGPGTMHLTNGVSRAMFPPDEITGAVGGRSTSSQGNWTLETWGSLTPYFLVDIIGAGPRDDIRFNILDSQGQTVRSIRPGSYSVGGTQRTYQVEVILSDPVKSVSLEIIVSRALDFEFVIDPKQIQEQ